MLGGGTGEGGERYGEEAAEGLKEDNVEYSTNEPETDEDVVEDLSDEQEEEREEGASPENESPAAGGTSELEGLSLEPKPANSPPRNRTR